MLGTLDKLVSRNDAKKEPVSGDEVMKVVQRRLFQSIGDPAAIQEIANQQADLFRKFHFRHRSNSQTSKKHCNAPQCHCHHPQSD